MPRSCVYACFCPLHCHKTRSTCRETSSVVAPVALTAPSRGIKFYISREIIICAGAILARSWIGDAHGTRHSKRGSESFCKGFGLGPLLAGERFGGIKSSLTYWPCRRGASLRLISDWLPTVWLIEWNVPLVQRRVIQPASIPICCVPAVFSRSFSPAPTKFIHRRQTELHSCRVIQLVWRNTRCFMYLGVCGSLFISRCSRKVGIKSGEASVLRPNESSMFKRRAYILKRAQSGW